MVNLGNRLLMKSFLRKMVCSKPLPAAQKEGVLLSGNNLLLKKLVFVFRTVVSAGLGGGMAGGGKGCPFSSFQFLSCSTDKLISKFSLSSPYFCLNPGGGTAGGSTGSAQYP